MNFLQNVELLIPGELALTLNQIQFLGQFIQGLNRQIKIFFSPYILIHSHQKFISFGYRAAFNFTKVYQAKARLRRAPSFILNIWLQLGLQDYSFVNEGRNLCGFKCML